MKSPLFKSALLSSVALLSLSLLSCQQTTFVPPPVPPVAQLQRQLNAPQPVREQVLSHQETVTFKDPVPVAVEPDRLVFQGTQHQFQPQQVLIGRSLQNQDFLRRVRSSRIQGNQVIVETLPATLFDAFQELDLAGPRMVRSPERISLQEHRVNIGGIMDLVIDLGLTPDFSDMRLKLKDGQLSVRMAPEFQMEAQVRSELRLQGMMSEVALRPVGAVNLLSTQFVAWIGPVPLVFHLRPAAALDFGARADGRLGVGTQLNGTVKAALELEAGLDQQPRTRSESSYRFDASMLPPNLRLSGEVRSRLTLPRIHLDSEIAGLVGPFIQTGPYIDGTYLRQLNGNGSGATVRESVRSQLGLVIDGGLTPTRLFGKNLSRELRVRILDRQIKEIYRSDTTRPLAEAEDLLIP